MTALNLKSFRTIQGCAVKLDIAPYIAMAVNDAHAEVLSIYRGSDAAAILHKHGHHTQAELYDDFVHHGGPAANRPGTSTHELKSDGRAFPTFPAGHDLLWWMQGFDINDVDGKADAVIKAAGKLGYRLFRPYPGGAEHHHLCFASQPKRPTPGTARWARLWRIRLTLPK